MEQIQLERVNTTESKLGEYIHKGDPFVCSKWAKRLGWTKDYVVLTLSGDPHPGASLFDYVGSAYCDEFEEDGSCEHTEGKDWNHDDHDECYDSAATLDEVLIPDVHLELRELAEDWEDHGFYFTVTQHDTWQDV